MKQLPKVHVHYNCKDSHGRLITTMQEPKLKVGTIVEAWQTGEEPFVGVIDEITPEGDYRIKIDWETPPDSV